MNTLTLSKMTISLLLVAMSPYANASQLSGKDITKIRSVLRGLNIDDSTISNNQIEMLRQQGSQFEQNQQDYNNRLDGKEIQMTCGAGSHGGDNDPV